MPLKKPGFFGRWQQRKQLFLQLYMDTATSRPVTERQFKKELSLHFRNWRKRIKRSGKQVDASWGAFLRYQAKKGKT